MAGCVEGVSRPPLLIGSGVLVLGLRGELEPEVKIESTYGFARHTSNANELSYAAEKAQSATYFGRKHLLRLLQLLELQQDLSESCVRRCRHDAFILILFSKLLAMERDQRQGRDSW